ncbi:uncharacterized protein LOC119613837 [Lucilia sericata]|uniref:uncharacterized protein LOC119613837 n=1 Tax=Lucilia sericata TaxID=13632 RepID=UPI0018A81634|nr:uncharacterized protein LOC119613837 [Lucilia sericata]
MIEISALFRQQCKEMPILKRFIEEENLLTPSNKEQDDDTMDRQREPTAQMAQGDRTDLVCQKEATIPLSQKESTAPMLQRDLTDPMWQKEPGVPFLLQREQGLINSGRGVDLLLSNQFVFDLICDGQIIDKKTNTKLRNTKLGWVAYGLMIANGSKPESSVVTTIQTSCDELLQKFWELDEIPKMNNLTVAEKQCEQHFEENFKRLTDGKFEVKLPFKDEQNKLDNSTIIAKRRPESTTTKLRVVFDASCKTTTNVSLNDILHTGPRLQEDLFKILLRFRKHRYVFSADIEKVYRQIWISEADRKYQLIFWRWNPEETIKTYALKTVTYGTASAPYLAVKCLQKITDCKEDNFSIESDVIRNDFYMDDLMTGGDCIESLKRVRENIDNILMEYGMPLRKWCTNEKVLLQGIDPSYIENDLNIESNNLNSVKTLGIVWNPKTDRFSLKCKLEFHNKISKRTILSEVAKLFDPLGLIGSVTVTTKMLLQDLWKLKLDWDDNVPEQMTENWIKIKDNFKFLNEVNVPRLIICVKPTQIEVHGFCDASMKAYGAAVYVRFIDSNGIVYCHLAASKSRIAPIKILSLPRLELCAGVLLVELIKVVVDSFKIAFNDIFYYSDSTIVLSCLRLDPARLQIFVSNRVSFIQANSNINKWKHVSSEDNPADLISRGLLVKEIVENKFWFNGPKFLLKKEPYISRIFEKCEIPEIRKSAKVITAQEFGKINHRNNFNVLQIVDHRHLDGGLR